MSRMSNESEIICPITDVTSEIFEKILKKISEKGYALVIEDGNYVVVKINESDYKYITGVSHNNFIILGKRYLKRTRDCNNLDDYEYGALMSSVPEPKMTLKEYLSCEIAQEIYDQAINVNKEINAYKESGLDVIGNRPIFILKYERLPNNGYHFYVKKLHGEGVCYDYVESF